VIETLAPKLQSLLAELFAMQLPIVGDQDEAGAAAMIRVHRYSSGDMYSGYSMAERISLEGCAPLALSFTYSLHELSGQCDDWTLEISGAPDASRPRFAEAFHPRQQTSWWNQNISPSFRFDGTEVAF
jgi:hypothetical protein